MGCGRECAARNPELHAQHLKAKNAYYARTREKRRAVQRAWGTRHREVIAARQKARRLKDPERHRMYSRRKSKEWAEKHRERHRELHKIWYAANRDKAKERSREHGRRLRRELIEAYGSKCVCCGETTPEFLSLDHVRNNGAEERRRRKAAGTSLVVMLRKLGWPKDYQLLCFNCNCAKGFFGRCPHVKPWGDTGAYREFYPFRELRRTAP